MPPRTPPSAPDASEAATDFVEHIRTVHFVLLLTSVSLALAVWHSRLGRLSRAQDELQHVLAMSAQMDPASLRNVAANVVRIGGNPDPRLSYTDPSRTESRFQRIAVDGSSTIHEVELRYWPLHVSASIETASRPSTLGHFAAVWNRIHVERAYVMVAGRNLHPEGAFQIEPDDSPDAPPALDSATRFQVGVEQAALVTVRHERSAPVFRTKSPVAPATLTRLSVDGAEVGATIEPRRDLPPEQKLGIWDTAAATFQLISIPGEAGSLPWHDLALAGRNRPIAIAYYDQSKPPPEHLRIALYARTPAGLRRTRDFAGREPIAFVPDTGALLYSDPGRTALRLHPPADEDPPLALADGFGARAIAVSRDSRWVAASGHGPDGTDRSVIFSIEEPARISTLLAASTRSTEFLLAFSRDGRTLVALSGYQGSPRYSLSAWTVADGTASDHRTREVEIAVTGGMALSPDGKVLALGDGASVRFLDTLTLEERSDLPPVGIDSPHVYYLGDNPELTVLPALRPYHFAPYPPGSRLQRNNARLTAAKSGDPLLSGSDIQLVASSIGSKEEFLEYTFPFSDEDAVPERAVRSFVDLQRALLDANRATGYRTGSFETTFPNLAHVARFHRNSLFDDLSLAVAAELEEASETVEAFGLKIPVSSIRRWGALILIAIQLYLSRHVIFLHRYYREEIATCKAAWVGLYEDWLSRACTFLTAILLPVVACAVMVFWGNLPEWERPLDSPGWRLLDLAAIFFSGYCAIATFKVLRLLWADRKVYRADAVG